MNNPLLGQSVELISQLKQDKQTTFFECLTHNLFLLTQSVWTDNRISCRNKQRYLMSLNQIQIELLDQANPNLNWRRLFRVIARFAGQSDKLNQWLYEIVDESYQTALVA